MGEPALYPCSHSDLLKLFPSWYVQVRRIKRTDKVEETEEAKSEEEVKETTEVTEDIATKIDLKDIEVDSELDFWNAYFAKNAKSYDDLVAESKKEDTALLIVDALQGESGNACNLDNPCSLITALAKANSGGIILIREGDYELRQNINITQSGTEASPLVIRLSLIHI